MAMHNSSRKYSQTAALLHWLIAIFLIAALISGFVLDYIGSNASLILLIHLFIGGTTGALTVTRLFWWLIFDTSPTALSNKYSGIAKIVRVLFYIVPLGMTFSGFGILINSGAIQELLVAGSALPNFENFLPRIPHGMGARFLFILLGLHLSGVIYHQLWLKQDILSQMKWRK